MNRASALLTKVGAATKQRRDLPRKLAAGPEGQRQHGELRFAATEQSVPLVVPLTA
jgi:hypothetical protein